MRYGGSSYNFFSLHALYPLPPYAMAPGCRVLLTSES